MFNNLRTHHKVTSNKDALLLALQPGISGTTSKLGGTEDNAGAGLFFTKCIAQSTRNYFVVYSGDAYFKLRVTPKGEPICFNSKPEDDISTIRQGLPLFQGTLIGIDINISDTEVFHDIMNSIGGAFSSSLLRAKKDYYKKIRYT